MRLASGPWARALQLWQLHDARLRRPGPGTASWRQLSRSRAGRSPACGLQWESGSSRQGRRPDCSRSRAKGRSFSRAPHLCTMKLRNDESMREAARHCTAHKKKEHAHQERRGAPWCYRITSCSSARSFSRFTCIWIACVF